MPAHRKDQPKYRHHKARGLAFVQFRGQNPKYLGKHGSPESWEAYHRACAEHLAGIRLAPAPPVAEEKGETVAGLILQFVKYAKTRYVKDGEETSEVRLFQTALRPVAKLYGRTPAAEFGPLALIACREVLIRDGTCRTSVNRHVGRIVRVWKWGASREIVPAATWQALQSVEGLRKGQSVAPERAKVQPAPAAAVAAALEVMSPTLAAMVNVQLLTGARPGEVCRMRLMDLDMTGPVWIYRPGSHKRQHHGLDRIVMIGPRAQAVVKQFLTTDPEAYLFSPRESKEWYLARRRESRKTPVTPSAEKRRRKANPARKPGDRFNVAAYGHAIKSACLKAGVDVWAPNQLRHTAGTKIRAAFGIEGSRVILGHQSAVTSEIYSEADMEAAAKIMLELG